MSRHYWGVRHYFGKSISIGLPLTHLFFYNWVDDKFTYLTTNNSRFYALVSMTKEHISTFPELAALANQWFFFTSRVYHTLDVQNKHHLEISNSTIFFSSYWYFTINLMFRNAVAHKFQRKVSTCNSGFNTKCILTCQRWRRFTSTFFSSRTRIGFYT